ncbi:molybdopterin biosynthesis protein [Desulforegula conservatrix]|uniref:molybdopterin biosynthesis protein n=1 Tax=Desulforegula conservatrix TaxID=153026 RepID=UPI00042848F4|nr:molybdopterin biosynthesis protein [Desulforegula conservatrix]
MERKIYLNMLSIDEAKTKILESFPYTIKESETVPVLESVGRILASPVRAKYSHPSCHSAAMDGIAVSAEKAYSASDHSPVILTPGVDAFFINTGHKLPEETNAVIMMENLNNTDEGGIEIIAPAFPWQHVRKMGEDIVAGELIFPTNHEITPYCLAALITGGITDIKVRKQPKILVIPTGNELIDFELQPQDMPLNGNALECNSHVLVRLAEKAGAKAERHSIVKDKLESISATVTEAYKNGFDIVLTIGGSSAGSEDYAHHAASELGETLVHGVTMMPGKPLLAASINGKPFFGIPGYPVSAILSFETFVVPLIYSLQGKTYPERPTIRVKPTRKLSSKLGVEEFVRVKLGRVGENIIATPLPRGAGQITSIAQASGIIRIPSNCEGFPENAEIMAERLKPESEINSTVVVIGSHDNTLDLLSDMLRAKSGFTLSSSNVGSMGGLTAIRKDSCHIAGSHLLNTETGEYNISCIKKYLPDTEVKVINLVIRQQGLIIKKGNPKNISGIADLARNDITFINRQAGAGTRVLLDYEIKRASIAPNSIKGYENEEYTHMAVAAAVMSGRADAGMGIRAAANALDLDFIPVTNEQYDLVIPEKYFNSNMIQSVLEIINSDEFKSEVMKLGGYDTDMTGRTII